MSADKFSAVRKRLENKKKSSDPLTISDAHLTEDSVLIVCRACLSPANLQPIFRLSFEQHTLQELIEQVLSINVNEEDDGFPKSICLNCYTELINFYIFYQKCQNSTSILMSLPCLNKLEATETDKQTSVHISEDDLYNDNSQWDDSNDSFTVNKVLVPKTSNTTETQTTPKLLSNDSQKSQLLEGKENEISSNFSTDFENQDAKQVAKVKNYVNSKKVEGDNEDKLKENKDYIIIEVYSNKDKLKTARRNNKFIAKSKCQIRNTEKQNIWKLKRIKRDRFTCVHCNVNFNTYEEYKNHRIEVKHPREMRNHKCSICNKAFSSFKLKQHMRSHTKEQPYECRYCLRRFSLMGNLRRHEMTHTGERPHICEICGKGFIQSTSLHNHKRIHSKFESIKIDTENDLYFPCDFCGRGFKRRGPYNMHLRKKHSEEMTLENQHLIVEDSPREHVCDICRHAFRTRNQLKTHTRLTHGEKKFLCSECGKNYTTKAQLESHLKVHTGEKPYKCKICTKTFAHISSFDSHMLTHTGEKPFRCKHCSKSFTQRSHLKYHLRTHSGERPYACTFCGKSFALKGNLTVHTRTHTGETPFLCSLCGKGYYDSSSLKKHTRTHHGDGTITNDKPLAVAGDDVKILYDDIIGEVEIVEAVSDDMLNQDEGIVEGIENVILENQCEIKYKSGVSVRLAE